jgi:hypothetical protein
MKVDWYTRFCLTAIMVLLTVVVLGLWAEGVPSAGKALAADSNNKMFTPPPDRYQKYSTLNLDEMVGISTQTNQKLDEIKKLLESGNAKFQIVADQSSSAPPAAGAPVQGGVTYTEGEGNDSKASNP